MRINSEQTSDSTRARKPRRSNHSGSIERADAILATSLPYPAMPSREWAIGIAIKAENTIAAVTEAAGVIYDAQMAADRIESERAMIHLANPHRRTEKEIKQLRIDRDVRKKRNVNIMEPDKRTRREMVRSGLAGCIMVVLLAGCIATTTVATLDHPSIHGPSQAVLLAAAPFAGAFMLAWLVSWFKTVRPLALALAITINLITLACLLCWIYLFTNIFAVSALGDIDVLLDEVLEGTGSDGLADWKIAAFFYAALGFEVCGGATAKLVISRTLDRSERTHLTDPSEWTVEDEALTERCDELAKIDDAHSQLEARIATIDASRRRYCDEAAALLFTTNPSTGTNPNNAGARA